MKMKYKTSTVVDFVAKSDDPSIWLMILVEQGPWERNEISDELSRIQNRLYDSVDAAIDGQLATKFPETFGKIIQVQLDGYNLPEIEISEFFKSFSENIFKIQDYSLALENSKHVSGIKFELNLEKI